MSRSAVNKRLKRWPGWLALLFVVAGLLAVGISRDNGPQTPDERIVALEKRLACPVCQGESVYESRNSASVQIRELIRQGVDEGQLSDQQIIDDIVNRYNGEELLVPTSSGVEALAWALPAAAFVAGVAGLIVAFRRWHASARRLGDPTDEDYALVAAALEHDQFLEHDQLDDEP
jgi:cytochrome c-type biogenesis protein CcmH